jgi:integrase
VRSRKPARTTHDVRIWTVRTIRGKKGTTYSVRWIVVGKERTANFTTRALADSERAKLVTAMRHGEAFDVESGLPLSMLPDGRALSWWDWATQYADLKWASLAPTSRKSTAEALTTVTMALLSDTSRRPADELLRRAMMKWAFNAARRAAASPPEELAPAVAWLETATLPLHDLEDAAVARQVLSTIATRLDGTPAAATTITRKRTVFFNVLALAVEHGHLETHPLARVSWKPPRVNDVFDARAVVNPQQARALLTALRDLGAQWTGRRRSALDWHGRHLYAFFAAQYFSALRPSEAIALRDADLDLPETDGWGTLLVSLGDPEIAGTWTDSGRREARQLKHRAKGHVRPVPAPPELVIGLKRHMAEFGTTSDGRLFRGPHGGMMTNKAYTDVWEQARRLALTAAEVASPLAARPYDLRHTAVSTWLAAGVDSGQVAAWAGHSVAVLHRVYAHVLTGREDIARQRIDAILRADDDSSEE